MTAEEDMRRDDETGDSAAGDDEQWGETGRTRRRMLAGLGVTGTAGLAGCLSEFGLGGAGGSPYACTAIDDEEAERYDGSDNPLPFSFAVPTAMTRDDTQSAGRTGRAVFTKEWNQENPGEGGDRLFHSVTLRVTYAGRADESRPVLFDRERSVGSVIGKRVVDGERVALVQREATDTNVRLMLPYPATVEGERVYDQVRIEVGALIQGRAGAGSDAVSDDPDQTCGAALAAVAHDVLDSISSVEPTDAGTSLSLTPGSASVRRGEAVDLTVETSGVDWVDLVVEPAEGGGGIDERFAFLGSLAVGDGPATLTVAPSSETGPSDVVTTADARLDTLTAVGTVEPGPYTVEIRGAGTDGLVTATASLDVRPAN